MSDAVIDRLIELAVAKDRRASGSVFGRVLWGFRANAARAAARIQAYLDRHDGEDTATAIRAINLYFELTDSVPSGVEKFADSGTYKIFFAPKSPFLPQSEEELRQRVLLRSAAPNAEDNVRTVFR